jgi:hypothetical protein
VEREGLLRKGHGFLNVRVWQKHQLYFTVASLEYTPTNKTEAIA